jgi:flagellar hook-associated protein 1
MTLSLASTIASKSLGVISSQISVVSRNISGAGTAGVSAKLAKVAASEDGVDFLGVGRATNASLFRNLLSANASQGSANRLADSLDQIDEALSLSDPTNSRSPAALITKLTSALQTYSASPQNENAAQLTLIAAQNLATALHDGTVATQNQRRDADTGIASAVGDVNELLAKFSDLNGVVTAGTANGTDVTDALDQRDGILTELSSKIGITTVTRANNDMVIYTDSGVTLFETSPRKVTFQETATLSPGIDGAAVYVDGVPVTGASAPLAIRNGAIQGMTQIRDSIAPQYQRQLDEIARGLVVAFSEKDQSGGGGQPLPGLFTYPGATNAPGPTLINGLAGSIEVNANVDPARGGVITRLRDGGISGNPNYVYNTTGASGYAVRLLQLANAASTPQSFDPSSGLTATGSLNGIATDSIGWVGAQRKQAEGAKTYSDAVVAQTTQALSNSTGVNLDDQMSQMLALENSYQASAKLMEAVNSLFTALFAALHA